MKAIKVTNTVTMAIVKNIKTKIKVRKTKNGSAIKTDAVFCFVLIKYFLGFILNKLKSLL